VGAEPDIAAIRRTIADRVNRFGAAPERRARAELVVTELATNLLRHAGGTDLDPGAELFGHDPAVIAAALHRDHTRDRDDATVVVVRNLGDQ
jgi:hypothetical protein